MNIIFWPKKLVFTESVGENLGKWDVFYFENSWFGKMAALAFLRTITP